MTHPSASEAADGFCLPGPVVRLERYGEGLIHDTYIITCRAPKRPERFILQRINESVFTDPSVLMSNIERVVLCLQERARRNGRDPRREVVSLVRTPDDASWLRLENGTWRMIRWVEGTKTLQRITDMEGARQIGLAFGRFLTDVSDLDPADLAVALPGYRDTERYLQWLDAAIEEDRFGRVAYVREEIDFAKARRQDTLFLQSLQKSGRMRVYAIHGDTKLDNVLVDAVTGEAVCVIDLDTVMPGLRLHDLGDCLREALIRSDVPISGFTADDLRIVEGIASGFFSELDPPPNKREVDSVVAALASITLELSVRFLADHLSGDSYFRTSHSKQNLDRARRHFQLFREVERRRSEMDSLVERCVRTMR